MTDRTPISCEARLMGLSKQRRRDGDWTEVKFHIHPDDTPHALFILPLGTDCNLSIKGTDEDAETAPTVNTEAPTVDSISERPKGGARAKRAGILCNDRTFQNWFLNQPGLYRQFPDDMHDGEICAEQLRWRCGIHSRAALDHNQGAGRIFDGIVADFEHAQRGGDEELARQAAEGPG